MQCMDKIKVAEDAGNRFDVWNRHWTNGQDVPADHRTLKHFSDNLQQGRQMPRFRRSEGKLTFSSNRERWYYMALANCMDETECQGQDPDYCTGGLQVHYKLNFENGEGWDKHLSADAQGIAEASIGLLIFWLFAGCCIGIQVR